MTTTTKRPSSYPELTRRQCIEVWESYCKSNKGDANHPACRGIRRKGKRS